MLPIFPSNVVLLLVTERPKSAFISIHGDNFQVSVLREAGQYDRSFQARNVRILAIVLQNVPFSQHIDCYTCFINAFPVFQHIFKVSEGNVPLCHSENSMLCKVAN